MPVESEYLRFERYTLSGRKTPVVDVVSRSSNDLLGTIKWYGPWRQFCFYPEPGTIFNSGCMTDIQGVVTGLMEERK